MSSQKFKNCMSNKLECLRLCFIFIMSLGGLKLTHGQTHSIILGRPTQNSITISVLFDQASFFYIKYGQQPGLLNQSTTPMLSLPTASTHFDLTNLNPHTRYYYRVYYRTDSTLPYSATPEYTFCTQRSLGSSFTFTIEADEHLYDKKGVPSLYEITLANQVADSPDFIVSLGDIFGDDHEPFTIGSGELDTLHRYYRPFLGKACHSIPFYICLGNHEGENDYYYGLNPPDNLAIMATLWRKKYYPNPYPNGFYTGNTMQEPFGIGYPENYYAWHWGDALFVVLDAYRDQCDTSPRPGGWNWTLGLPQYTWLKNTLENSTATHKFVFAHHVRGQGRGGISNAKLFEWGGYDGPNGVNYNFPNKRPGWSKPIHNLFKDNNVKIFFQGHDHVFARESFDSVIYQASPMAADSTYEIGMLANASAYTSDTLPGSGHLRVKVTPQCVQVDFVRAYLPADTLGGIHRNREVAFSYRVGQCPGTGFDPLWGKLNVSVSPNPAKNYLSLNFWEEIPHFTAQIHNALGQIILTSHEKEISIHEIPEGYYWIVVKAGQRIHRQRIVIQH